MVFYRQFEATQAKVERVFKHLGGFHHHFWQYELSHSICGDIDPEIDSRFGLLMPIISLMKELTTYTIHLLIDLGAISLTGLKAKFDAAGQNIRFKPYEWIFGEGLLGAVSRYNRLIDSGKVPGSSLLGTRLLDVSPPSSEIRSEKKDGKLTLVAKCYDELHTVLFAYSPEYRILEGDFPFAPVERSRDRMDGTHEILINNAYILTNKDRS
ncbi:MAG TPA: hypothetical protein PLR20_16145 [Syntrophales bacterium]|nr:hypothetical protein [Syntrophales bacterium]